jgi:hypothetical protein
MILGRDLALSVVELTSGAPNVSDQAAPAPKAVTEGVQPS